MQIFKRTESFVMWLTSCVVLGSLSLAQSAPVLFNFQGRLTDSMGAPVTTATTVAFKVILGGTATEPLSTGAPVYEESTSITPDANGVFTHVIGNGTPAMGETLIEDDLQTGGTPLYVEVSVAGEVILPRTQLMSVPYAIESSRLDGLTAQSIIGQSGGSAFANAVVRHGARLEWLSASQVQVLPGTLGFSDGIVRRNTTALTWDFAAGTGPLGLDTGAEAADTWYYIYAIPDPSDDSQFSAVASANSPTQIGGSGPTAFGVHRFLGSFKNDSGMDILQFFRTGTSVSWGGRVAPWLQTSGSAQPSVNTWVSVDASAWMPETSRAVAINGYYDAYSNAGIRFLVGPGPAPPIRNYYFCVDWQNGAGTCDTTIPTTNQTFSYYAVLVGGFTNDAGQSTQLWYTGYEEDLNEF